MASETAVVVGGGLAGMSAANTILENNGRVVLVDKSAFCGGNSTKATSGINGAGTRTQQMKGIPDTKERFVKDTLKGGAKKPELAEVLCNNSGADVDWLMDIFHLDLSLVARLGGHSEPRTHRGKERFPGMTITYALIQMVEKVAEKCDRARIITKARAHTLVMGNGMCRGLVYEKGGQNIEQLGPVILASGGFGADFTNDSLLAMYRPDLLHLPTTNGEHCTGDGIKMGEKIGARTIDLEWVQVHPTGLVKPSEADSKIKFLAAEALRGVGGIILNKDGIRFANELGRRDYVTGEMWKNKPPFRLCLNEAASTEIIWHCKHYTSRGVMKHYTSGEDLARDMGIDVKVLEETHKIHYEAAQKQAKDPDSGPHPAYPDGKTWDEPSGKTGSGKKFFHNIIPGSAVRTQKFYVAIITPVIHYCMGGLEVDVNSMVLDASGNGIPGLYAAGEVAGGIHGNNRLGGNSLLDCVVFGRVAGRHAAQAMLGANFKAIDLNKLAGNQQAIVVGGGLAGMSAANTVMENNGKVILIDKSAFCGGNSTKATSGINGAGTRTQKDKGIGDTKELFIKDTLKGGAKKPELANVLCNNSGPDVDWLMDKFNLDLSLVARLGGHSEPRTHRGKERFPGMTITYALIQMVEKVAEKCDKAQIITKARAHTLLMKDGACVGLTYEKDGENQDAIGPVILASGGFGADFTNNSLLAMYRPDLLHLPTTNGEHCTGDGIKMGEMIGGRTIDLEWVQVHPTGLVKPSEADSKIKFLAAEALRGVGGIILNKEGIRFANELGRRDYVTGEMWKNKPPFRLCLNEAASTEIIWHCKHYTSRGVMKYYQSGEELAADMGVALSVLEQTHEIHYLAATKQKESPDGGPHPAYPDGRTWDEPSGKTGSGKKFFHNIIPGSAVKTQKFYVAIITPVIHYCMGGLEVDVNSVVLNTEGRPIPGLYAAGEVAGGIHGNNRLGGNSLLDCVVFGRVSGRHAAQYMLGDDFKPVDLIELSGGGLTGEVADPQSGGGAYEDKKGAKKKKKSSGPGYTMEQVATHNTKESCWVVLHGKVLDVTNFLSDHPGGELAILTFAGKDATEEFDMIHPANVIDKYAPDVTIGALGEGGDGEEEDDDDDDDGDAGGYTLEEVAKHNSKESCWVVLHGKVLDVTKFLSDHPGGELAILTFAGKDATEEFDMIHPANVIDKYAPDTIIGVVGKGGGGGGKKKKKGATGEKKGKDKGDFVANHHAWGSHDGANWRIEAYDENPGVLIIPVKAYFFAAIHLILAIVIECLKTIFVNKNFKITNDRVGLTRSAILLILFMVIHAVGNLHVFLGPDDFNGYGYFYVRLYWTGFGLPANIVEEYILLSALLHVFVALKRTWDMKLKMGIMSGQLNLAISGVILLSFMTIHLFQFRFGDTVPYFIRPPPYLINFWAILGLRLSLFWCDQSFQDCGADTAIVGVRDIYKLEFDIFQRPTNFPFGDSCNTNPFASLPYGLGDQVPALPCTSIPNFWAGFYIFSVFIFMIHACLGWNKVVPALGIPKGHHKRVNWIGYLIFWTLGLIYISFPAYVMTTEKRFCGWESDVTTPENFLNLQYGNATDCTQPSRG